MTRSQGYRPHDHIILIVLYILRDIDPPGLCYPGVDGRQPSPSFGINETQPTPFWKMAECLFAEEGESKPVPALQILYRCGNYFRRLTWKLQYVVNNKPVFNRVARYTPWILSLRVSGTILRSPESRRGRNSWRIKLTWNIQRDRPQHSISHDVWINQYDDENVFDQNLNKWQYILDLEI